MSFSEIAIVRTKDHVRLTNKIIGFLEKLHSNEFNMGMWMSDHGCHTIGCIGGWTSRLMYKSDVISEKKIGEEIFGINERSVMNLFYMYDVRDKINISGVKKKHAIAVLKNLQKTGEVDWLKVLKA